MLYIKTLCGSVLAVGFAASPAPADDLDGQIQAIAAAHPNLIQLDQIGRSRQERPLHLLRLASAGPVDPDARPALLIAAGLDGRHAVGVETALGVAESLATDHAELLTSYTVYILPCMNPDGWAYHQDPASLKIDFGRTIAPYDADHDGRTDEDGPDDLNGDGIITMMRIANPDPDSGLTADLMIDPEDERVLRAPKPEEGERATHAVLIEGIDNDGDGSFNEDGAGGTAGGGVDLNMNFMHQWPQFTDGAGDYQLCEPESQALCQWVLAHDNIVAAFVFGPHDNLLNLPATGKNDQTGRAPTGIEKDDKPVYEQLAKAFKEITKMTGSPNPKADGSFHTWAYAQFGAYAFSTPVWVRPDLIKTEEEKEDGEEGEDKPENGEKPDEGEELIGGMTVAEIEAKVQEMMSASDEDRAAMFQEFQKLPQEARDRMRTMFQQQGAGGGRPGGGRGGRGGGRGGPGGGGGARGGSGDDAKPKGASSDDGKWLKYIDETLEGEGFVAWEQVDHPQLGQVEVGGFVPGVKMNPKPEELPRLIDEQTRFAVELLGSFPDLQIDEPVVEKLGPNLWRIGVKISNEGAMPWFSAIGAKNRRLAPTLVLIELPQESIVSGSKISRFDRLEGLGDFGYAQWTIHAEDGSDVSLVFRSNLLGETRLNITLEEAAQ